MAPVAEAVGLALSSAGLAQLPVVEGARAVWRRIQYDYDEDFAKIQDRVKILQIQTQLFMQDPIFKKTGIDTPESIMISEMQGVTAALNGARKLCKEYHTIAEEEKKVWRQLNEKELGLAIDSAEKRLGFILAVYDTYQKVMVSKTCERLEVWLDRVGRTKEDSNDSEEEKEEEGPREDRCDKCDQCIQGEKEMKGREQKKREQREGLNPNTVYMSLIAIFASVVAIRRFAKGIYAWA